MVGRINRVRKKRFTSRELQVFGWPVWFNLLVYALSKSLIAQLVERRTVNPQVVGSSPTRGANTYEYFKDFPSSYTLPFQWNVTSL